ncbi:MAG: C10 family peptidase, partial [Candidatus Delongbacteria bacterium]|nr:C10 family peptidase [Candidatus Delongbacteria bacterium]
MKKFIILFLSLTFVVSAAFVPVERAQKVAENYYQNYAPVSEKGNAVQKILTKEYLGQLTWYVFRFTKGFVIVSADDAVRAILGYSFDGKIDEDIYNMNNPFVHRFSFYDKQIVHTVRENGYVDASAQKEWKNIENKFFPANSTAKLHRDPLLETMWHQNYPFNNQCPSGYPSGSTAIAMAQIMRYHGSPRTGWGSAYYIDNTGDSTGVHSVNYNDQYYDWSLMTTLDGNDMTADEINEVSKLVYQVGVSTKTDYNNDISTASLEDAGNAFEGYFGYGDLYHGPVYENLGTITEPSFFNETITGYINGHCPLLWGNLNASFVLDGYNINSESGIYEYHFNWGWGGAYDGWFWINDLTPGSNDYTAFQECVYHLYPYWPYAMWAPPQSLQCTITDLENVTMTWEWDTGSEYLILSRFDILLDGELIDSVPDSVMSYYFEGVCVGEHTFTAEAVFGYEFYPEWYSSPSGVTLEILPEENFPVPYFTQEASAELYNRQKIELAWAKPFCGTEYINEGFETGTGNYEVVTDGWIQKGSDNCPPSSWNDLTDAGWKYISKYGGTYYYKNTYEGIWAAYCNYFYGDDNAPFTYLISSDQLSVTGDPVLSFWIKSGTFDSDLQIVKYTGDFTETDPSVYTEIISVVSPDTLGTWEYKYVHLPEGNYRIGIVKDTGKGWSIIDNLFLGSDTYPDGNQPVSYDIYRNDILADNVPVSGLYEQYEDKTFTENWNEYYIRAIYPAGSSLKSKPTKVYINANPVPLSLRGTYDNTNSKVDLSWYYPGHYPPHWFGYNYESDTYSYFEWDYDSRYLQKCVILYDPLDFDMTFPIHIERVGASFYEDTNNDNYWTTDQFRFIIAEGSFSSEDIIYTSPWLTADPSGKWCDHKLPETLTLNEKWYVAVEQGDPATGTPSIMLNLHHTDTDEPVWHSLFQSSSSPTSAGSWQALNYKDYSISCYGYNDESVITKQNISDTAIDISDNTVKPFKQNTSFINVKPDRE